jgi:hypothetical protein
VEDGLQVGAREAEAQQECYSPGWEGMVVCTHILMCLQTVLRSIQKMSQRVQGSLNFYKANTPVTTFLAPRRAPATTPHNRETSLLMSDLEIRFAVSESHTTAVTEVLALLASSLNLLTVSHLQPWV